MEHIVDYKKYCRLCVKSGTDEHEEPCEECLSYPVNDDTHKPIMFKAKDQNNERA